MTPDWENPLGDLCCTCRLAKRGGVIVDSGLVQFDKMKVLLGDVS